MKPLPSKAILRLIRGWSEELQQDPTLHGTFLYRGDIVIDKEGEAGFAARVEAELPEGAPAGGEIGGGFRSTWDNIGKNEIVIRIERPSGRIPTGPEDEEP